MIECRKCHQVHTGCTGHNRQGGPCGGGVLRNQKVCRHHGGASPQALEVARRREVELRAEKLLRERWANGGDVAVDDPLGELARLAGEAVAFKDYLRDQVTELDGVLAYWTEDTFTSGTGEDAELRTTATEQLRAVVLAYERALDRCAKILASIVKLDLAGRMLAVRTEQAEAIVTAVRMGLAQVDMSAELRKGAQEAIADALANMARPAEIMG
jgi:hypothetical protein